jgi:hypothetical protein
MVRKTIILLVSAILLLGTSGITVSMHYCGNSFISYNFTGKAKSCCGKNCKSCHDKNIHIKVSDNYLMPFISALPDVTDFLTFNLPVNFPNQGINNSIVCSKIYSDSSPPIYKYSATFLEVFRL